MVMIDLPNKDTCCLGELHQFQDSAHAGAVSCRGWAHLASESESLLQQLPGSLVLMRPCLFAMFQRACMFAFLCVTRLQMCDVMYSCMQACVPSESGKPSTPDPKTSRSDSFSSLVKAAAVASMMCCCFTGCPSTLFAGRDSGLPCIISIHSHTWQWPSSYGHHGVAVTYLHENIVSMCGIRSMSV